MVAGTARPSKADLARAAGKRVPDVIAAKLRVLFCGINPGLYSGAVGHHFARPGNRFWPALYAAGFTDRLLSPAEERELLKYGLGITNFVNRATANANELTKAALTAGARRLVQKAKRFRPRVVAVLGVSAYRVAFKRPHARIGKQPELIGSAGLWLLPNTSGLNAHFTPARFAKVFRELRLHIGKP